MVFNPKDLDNAIVLSIICYLGPGFLAVLFYFDIPTLKTIDTLFVLLLSMIISFSIFQWYHFWAILQAKTDLLNTEKRPSKSRADWDNMARYSNALLAGYMTALLFLHSFRSIPTYYMIALMVLSPLIDFLRIFILNQFSATREVKKK